KWGALLSQDLLETRTFSVRRQRASQDLRRIIGRLLAITRSAPTRGEGGADGQTTLQEPTASGHRGDGRLEPALGTLHSDLLHNGNDAGSSTLCHVRTRVKVILDPAAAGR